MMSPLGGEWRLKRGRMTWVMLIRPVTLVENIVSISWAFMSGALSTPFTRPLEEYLSAWEEEEDKEEDEGQ